MAPTRARRFYQYPLAVVIWEVPTPPSQRLRVAWVGLPSVPSVVCVERKGTTDARPPFPCHLVYGVVKSRREIPEVHPVHDGPPCPSRVAPFDFDVRVQPVV